MTDHDINLRIALFEPRIPQNTGNIGRTCLAYGFNLDLILPLGFSLDDKHLKRAGLDYWKSVNYHTFDSFSSYKYEMGTSRIIAFSKKGGEELYNIKFKHNDCLLFGREDYGLPIDIKDNCDLIASIEMPKIFSTPNPENGVRSLNLSVACGIAAYNSYTKLTKSN